MSPRPKVVDLIANDPELTSMALGLTDHVWSIRELIDAALAIVPEELGRRRKPVKLTVIEGGKE